MHSIKDTVKQLIGKSLDAYNKKYTSPINNRIDNIVAQAGTDNTEIVDARIDSAGVSHTTLNNRILAETKMTDEKLIEYSGSSLSVDDTMPGYLQNIEIFGNTIQNEDNLEDIRSVGNKIEGQELYEIPVLSCGKNLINVNEVVINEGVSTSTGNFGVDITRSRTSYIKFNPNVNYVAINVEAVFFYDKNKQFISVDRTLKGVSPSNCNYIVVRMLNTTNNWQLEEGTVATPYEPYVGDKLTILSPVQLEKVGDVADRIICKDGVWGVEKNVETVVLDGNTVINNINTTNFTNINYVGITIESMKTGKNLPIICNRFITESYVSSKDYEYVYTWSWDNKPCIYINFLKSKGSTINEFKQWLEANNVLVKYQLATSTFIPLPHDQQVKLRTFANKTNISFLTEIEGTIKAQVPKSLGATVNTHTTQISNLNKELDRVKKLEESTVSTVETESDFTTVEATSNGYFEDVKLEGKTLTNIVTTYDVSRFSLLNTIKQDDGYFKLQYGATVNNSNVIPRYGVHLYKPNTTYTIIVDIKENTTGTLLGISAINSCIDSKTISARDFTNLTGISTITFKTRDDITISDKGVLPTYDLYFGIWKDGGDLSKHITFKYWVLEGDHTQNPPSYFEGLKSVGQDIDEIVVSSVNENLFNGVIKNQTVDTQGRIVSDEKARSTDYIEVPSNCDIAINVKKLNQDRNGIIEYNANKEFIKFNNAITLLNDGKYIFKTDINTKYIIYYYNSSTQVANEDIPNHIMVTVGTIPKPYKPHQSDKKRLLYYNNETQTWEKPILREWDSIEKHANGKYYYHQRSGEVVFNGSENWNMSSVLGVSTTRFWTSDYVGVPSKNNDTYVFAIISDLFNYGYSYNEVCNLDIEGVTLAQEGNIGINILNEKLSTINTNGFKQWLQTNNVTVVYQLAQEKVYECTNIDLITYANETNYIVECGAIVPRTTLKVHNNISNVVSLLQKKVSLLESNMTKYMITQNRMQLASTYSADSVTFKVDYALCSEEVEYNEDLYNLILNNILVGKDNYDYSKMFNIILDYASWNQISWEQFDILVGVMDSQHNPPIEEEIPNEIM